MNDIVEHYDQVWRSIDFPPYLRSLYRTMDQLPLEPHCRVLDIACGNGSFGEWFHERFDAEMYGVDYSPVAVEMCRGKGYQRVETVDLDKDRIPFEDNYFDLVILSAVLEHIMSPEDVLKQAFERLKPGGRVIVLTPNISWIINRILFLFGRWDHVLMGGTRGHISYMNKKQLDTVMTNAGFKDIDWSNSVIVVKGSGANLRSSIAQRIVRLFNDRRTRIWPSLWAFNFIVVANKPHEGSTDDTADLPEESRTA